MEKMSKSSIVFFVIVILNSFSFFTLKGQQLEIDRIEQMPNLPQPYHMRNWKEVAKGYDSLVFNQSLSGEFLPLVFFRENSVNYPNDISFGLHTAVGTNYPTSGEAINAMPAVIGATLVGIDKNNQFGHNWASMLKEFFNKRPQENIYLNHPVTSSGYDWWYETMPNVFFMQLKYLYPDIVEFEEQIGIMANQWLTAIRAMGASDTPWTVPYMNYRAWSMESMTPLDQGVKQPEAAGAIAWILYNAYGTTGNIEFLKGAEWALEFLSDWNENPSYELQLPYGVYTAARMNAEIGTNYDVEKMLNWCFNRGDLRGWGAIVGNWGGYDCSGLIGEANDSGNDYAFMMNGFQQATALVPLLRYDYRFSKSIAKWVLNMANASRLFYPSFLPQNQQDNAQWAQDYDAESYIAYEALKEVKHGYSPFATGDAIEGGWAQTNLMLYSSSHVGMLASIIDTTNIEGILQIDLLKTDFYRQDAYPTFLYYNPHEETHFVDIFLPSGSFKLYDVIEKEFILESQVSTSSFSLPANSVAMLVLVPQDAEIAISGKQTLANEVIIDFDNGMPAGGTPPRIKALASADTILVMGNTTVVYCTATDQNNQELLYKWFYNSSTENAESSIVYTAPNEEGIYYVACKVTNEDGLSDSLSIGIKVVEKIPYPPQILGIKASPRKCRPGEVIEIYCEAEDYYNEPLAYTWSAQSGTFEGEGEVVSFAAPSQEGYYYISCKVSNPDGLIESDSVRIIVRNFADDPEGDRVAFYPLRGNADDASGNNLHGTAGGGITWTQDMNGNTNYAARFNGTSANILLPSSELLNFSNSMSLAMFIKVDELTANEQHPISHGSWEHRYKISVTNGRFRFTVNSTDGIVDLDSETAIEPNSWYHLVAIYSGVDLEMWINGELDAFTNHSGTINQSPVNAVMGQNLPGNNNYNFKGDMALVSIFNFPLSPNQVNENFLLAVPSIEQIFVANNLIVYPNPLNHNTLNLHFDSKGIDYVIYQIFDLRGTLMVNYRYSLAENGLIPKTISIPSSLLTGMYFVKVFSSRGVLATRLVISR